MNKNTCISVLRVVNSWPADVLSCAIILSVSV